MFTIFSELSSYCKLNRTKLVDILYSTVDILSEDVIVQKLKKIQTPTGKMEGRHVGSVSTFTFHHHVKSRSYSRDDYLDNFQTT